MTNPTLDELHTVTNASIWMTDATNFEATDDEAVVPYATWSEMVRTVRKLYGCAFEEKLPFLLPRIVPCPDGSVDLYWRHPAGTHKFLLNIVAHAESGSYVYDFASIMPGSETESRIETNVQHELLQPCITLFLQWLEALPEC
jgi:hypothetical protein